MELGYTLDLNPLSAIFHGSSRRLDIYLLLRATNFDKNLFPSNWSAFEDPLQQITDYQIHLKIGTSDRQVSKWLIHSILTGDILSRCSFEVQFHRQGYFSAPSIMTRDDIFSAPSHYNNATRTVTLTTDEQADWLLSDSRDKYLHDLLNPFGRSGRRAGN